MRGVMTTLALEEAVGGRLAEAQLVEDREEKRKKVVSNVATRVTCPENVPAAAEEEGRVEAAVVGNVVKTVTLPRSVPTVEVVEMEITPAGNANKKDTWLRIVSSLMSATNVSKRATWPGTASCQTSVANVRARVTLPATVSYPIPATVVARRGTW